MTAWTLLVSAEQSAAGVGPSVDLGPVERLLRQTLTVVAQGGELEVWLEASANGIAWTRFAAIPDDGPMFIAPERFVRVAWTLEAPATFGVCGTRGIVYASLAQLYAHGRRESALSDVPLQERVSALVTATAKANSKLALRFDLPLLAWGDDLSEAVAKIAGYDLLSYQGYNPETGDKNIRARHDDAMRWLADVVDSRAEPVGLVDSTAEVEDDGIAVVSYPPRGWRR